MVKNRFCSYSNDCNLSCGDCGYGKSLNMFYEAGRRDKKEDVLSKVLSGVASLDRHSVLTRESSGASIRFDTVSLNGVIDVILNVKHEEENNEE